MDYIKVSDLVPGDRVSIYDTLNVTFVALYDPHPLYPRLALAIWWLEDLHKWSLDALRPSQEFSGKLLPNQDRVANLRAVLTPGTVL